MRQEQWATYVSIDGVPVPGPGISWDSTSGGDIDSDETKYSPGGMGSQRSLGGRRTPANITATKMLNEATGDWDAIRTYQARVGRASMSVVRQPLDTDGNAFGNPLTFTGILKTVTPPEANAEGNAAATWSVTQSTSDVS